MASSPSSKPRSTIREIGPWLGLGLGTFAVVAGVLLMLDEPAPQGSSSVAQDTDVGEPAAGGVVAGASGGPVPDTATDAAPPGTPTEPGEPTEPTADAPETATDAAASAEGDLTGEDLEDEKTAVGEIPPEGMPTVEQVAIPPGLIERVEGSRDWLVHVVVPGETVDQVAYRYGVKPASLRLWNGIETKAVRAKRGSRLRIKARQIPPPRVELEYVVQPGDSWASIGIGYGVDSKELRSANWSGGSQLTVGQILKMWVDPVVFEWVASEDGDPKRVRPGAVGIGPPQNGRLVNGVQIPKSPYYELRLPPSSYGTTFALEALLRGIVLFEARNTYERPLTFGSMSWRHGGPLTGHVSHQAGRDLDIQLPLLEKYPQWFPVEPERIDWVTTWDLVTAMVDTGDVVVVFLDYDLQNLLYKAAAKTGVSDTKLKTYLQWPRGAKAKGIVRHSRGHTTHIHVRFACGDFEVECADKTLGTE